jgi:hypothetical protein
MSTNHIEFHHELKQRIEFMRLAVTPAGFAVASVPEESRAAVPQPSRLRQQFQGKRSFWLGGRDRTSEWRNQNPLDY